MQPAPLTGTATIRTGDTSKLHPMMQPAPLTGTATDIHILVLFDPKIEDATRTPHGDGNWLCEPP